MLDFSRNSRMYFMDRRRLKSVRRKTPRDPLGVKVLRDLFRETESVAASSDRFNGSNI